MHTPHLAPPRPLSADLIRILQEIHLLFDDDLDAAYCVDLGGTTNQSFGVVTKRFRLVVRCPRAGTPAALNRQAEKHNTQIMSDRGINVPTLYFDPATGVKISPWLDGSSLQPSDLRDPAVLGEVCELLFKVHESPIEFQPSFRPLHIFDDLAATLPSLPPELVSYRDDFYACRDRFLSNGITVVASHADLYCANLFRAGRQLYLIDWEHSGQNPWLYDLADLSVQADLSPMEDDILVRLYAEKSGRAISRGSFFHAQQLSRLVWGCWALVRAMGNPDDSAHLLAGRRKLIQAREALRHGM